MVQTLPLHLFDPEQTFPCLLLGHVESDTGLAVVNEGLFANQLPNSFSHSLHGLPQAILCKFSRAPLLPSGAPHLRKELNSYLQRLARGLPPPSLDSI
jgi:hypothetical protein